VFSLNPQHSLLQEEVHSTHAMIVVTSHGG
jgi:hypothetical protein